MKSSKLRQVLLGVTAPVFGVHGDRVSAGRVVRAEAHWYEAHGIGRRDMKVEWLLG